MKLLYELKLFYNVFVSGHVFYMEAQTQLNIL